MGEPDARYSTLDTIASPEKAMRDRNYRRVGIVLLALIVLAGITGSLGVRTSSAVATNASASLRVSYPSVTRAGLAVPIEITVDSEAPLPRTLRVAISPDLFKQLDFQNVYPQPESMRRVGERLEFTFRTAESFDFEFFFDVRTGPDRQLVRETYEVEVVSLAEPLLVEFTVSVLP